MPVTHPDRHHKTKSKMIDLGQIYSCQDKRDMKRTITNKEKQIRKQIHQLRMMISDDASEQEIKSIHKQIDLLKRQAKY